MTRKLIYESINVLHLCDILLYVLVKQITEDCNEIWDWILHVILSCS